MTRRTVGRIEYDALSIEGAILPAEWLGKVAALEAPAQSPSDYGVPRGLQLRDEISRYWKIAAAAWSEFTTARAASAATAGSTDRFVEQLLAQAFGFADLEPGVPHEVGGRTFTATFSAVAKRVPVFVASHEESLDHNADRHGDDTRRRSAWGALQEYLNAFDGSLWGLAINGLTLRLGRDNASLTRPAWLEADLERLFTEERFADFSVLWLVLHASRFGRPANSLTESPLETWREAAQSQGSRARDSLRDGVERTLLELGQGFIEHPANEPLRTAIASGELSRDAYFAELLRLVYRMIFLLTVEERSLLHKPGTPAESEALYRDGYGVRRLRERSLRRSAHDRHADLWTSLRPVFRGLGSAAGEPALGLPGLGGLFSADQCPHLDRSTVSNSRFLAAVFHLAWMREGPSLVRVNWKDMGVEEFGSVYESLLELVPLVSTDAREFRFGGADVGAGNVRKTTGSYYTPDSLVQQLLDTALEPVVAARVAAVDGRNKPEVEHALLSITVVDPACGSGHFLLAAARRLAGHLARARSGGTPGASEYRLALRDVVTHCIHGVDRNPMALELARMALWLEAYTPERALGFIDHHLLCGDALIGVERLNVLIDGIPDSAYRPIGNDSVELCRHLTQRNRLAKESAFKAQRTAQISIPGLSGLVESFHTLDTTSDFAVADVTRKNAEYRELRSRVSNSPIASAADCVVGAFLMEKVREPASPPRSLASDADLYPTSGSVFALLEDSLRTTHSAVKAAGDACRGASALHWPLAFPSVMNRGGFDVVIGNPPWKLLSSPSPEQDDVLSEEADPEGGLADGSRAREQALFREGAYSVVGGRRDLYKLFLTRGLELLSDQGRLAFILPFGMFVEDNSSDLRKLIFADASVTHLLHLQNSRKSFFPEVHASYRFNCLTVSKAPAATHRFSTLITSPDKLVPLNWVTLPQEQARAMMGETLSSITFGTPDEYTVHSGVVRRLRRRAPLTFSIEAEFHATTHKRFVSRTRNEPSDWLLLKNRSIRQFNWRFGPPGGYIAAAMVEERLRAKGLSAASWMSRSRLLFRDIARGDDARTIIAAKVESGCVSSYDTPMIVPSVKDEWWDDALTFYEALLNSLLFDFLARPFVDKHVKGYVLRQLPIPAYDPSDPLVARLIPLGRRISAQLASDGKSASIDIGRQFVTLNAEVFHWAQLSESEVETVLRSFPVFWRSEGASLGGAEAVRESFALCIKQSSDS